LELAGLEHLGRPTDQMAATLRSPQLHLTVVAVAETTLLAQRQGRAGLEDRVVVEALDQAALETRQRLPHRKATTVLLEVVLAHSLVAAVAADRLKTAWLVLHQKAETAGMELFPQ
jgi:hypothetical protein